LTMQNGLKVGGAEDQSQRKNEEMERRAKLLSTLARNRAEWHIEYQTFLSNHMSHYLIALYKLGASAERLEEAYKSYSEGLEPRIPPVGLNLHDESDGGMSDWLDLRGRKQFYSDLILFFHDEIETRGIKTTLNTYVQHLASGSAGSAFHGLIQLGYGLEILDNENIAEGLAYWTYCWFPLGPLSQNEAAASSPFELLDKLRNDAALNDVYKGVETKKEWGWFQTRVHYLAEAKGGKYLSLLRPYDIHLPLPQDKTKAKETVDGYIKIFSLVVLKVFAGTGCEGFFLLHLITGMRALKMVLLQLDDNPDLQVRVLRFFWRAVIGAYVAVGRPEVKDLDEVPNHEDVDGLSWEQIIEKVIPSSDEHLVKLVFVCWTEANEYPDAAHLFKQTAAKAINVLNERNWNFKS
jgi:hypothetical protein